MIFEQKLLLGAHLLIVAGRMTTAFPSVGENHPGHGREVTHLASIINDFSRRLTSELSGNDVNILISPLSISSVLAMMSLGAAGETRTEIQRVCGFQSNEAIKEEFNILHTTFLSPIGVVEKGQSEVTLANGIFYDWAQILKTEFWNKLQYFRAEAKTVNFKFDSENARDAINTWVRNKTRGMIEDILPPKSVNSKTQAIITNAVYFSGAWKFPFNSFRTTMETFTTLTGDKIQVPMLERESRLAFNKMCSEAERSVVFNRMCTNAPQPDVVEIPYANGNYVMVILVPNQQFSFADIETNLKRSYKKWRHGTLSRDVELSIPKFKVSFQTDLKPTLQKMGITKAFSHSEANFDNMSEGKIVFERFIHKSSIVVDETGTRAAASSSAIGVLKGAATGRVTFRVDRPFYFFIEDKNNEVQLFAGRITNPTKTDNVL